MNKYETDHLLINGIFIIFNFHTIAKILSKVITHIRLKRYNDGAYKSQYCKGIHLIDRGRLLKINSRSIHLSKKCYIYQVMVMLKLEKTSV